MAFTIALQLVAMPPDPRFPVCGPLSGIGFAHHADQN